MGNASVYIGIIGDLITSRTIADRGAAQKQLQAALEGVNTRFQAHLASRFTITLGDEFQGLLLPGAPVFLMLDLIESALYPHPCRFGIGLGPMLTPIRHELSIGADGPAFWNAREAIKSVHAQDDYGRTRTRLMGCADLHAPLINSLLATTDGIKRSFSDLQWNTFFSLISEGIYSDSFDQQAAAERLGITPEALYRRLKISGIKLYLRSRADLSTWLTRQLEAAKGDRE